VLISCTRTASRRTCCGPRQRRPRLVIGIDGPGATGKSTLAAQLADALGGAAVVHGDDFYLPAKRRPGGDFGPGDQYDLARLLAQVLRPATLGQPVRYQRYDWPSDSMAEWTVLAPARPFIVEGVYCTEATLRGSYTFRICCEASREVRLARGVHRDGEAFRSRWVDEWMPGEDRYLDAQQPAAHAHLVLDSPGSETGQSWFRITGGQAAAKIMAAE
jgi:uridine kinase